MKLTKEDKLAVLERMADWDRRGIDRIKWLDDDVDGKRRRWKTSSDRIRLKHG